MTLFSGPENYASLTAPFKKMADNLKNYIISQETNVKNFEIERSQLDANIHISKTEIAKSAFTVKKISDMVVMDFDENGIADVDELPDEESDKAIDMTMTLNNDDE